MKTSQLSDDAFLAAFESATIKDFHHADHIRVAWIYLQRLPFPEASRRMAESLRHFAASKGAHMKYHETITRAWMLLVWGALEQDRQGSGERTPSSEAGPDVLPGAAHTNHAAADFDAFAAAHPGLLDVHALKRFYSSPLLASPAARTDFVTPDISPLPALARTPQP